MNCLLQLLAPNEHIACTIYR